MVHLLPTVLTNAVGRSVDAVKNTFIHVGPALGQVDLHPHPGAGDGKKVSTWSAQPSKEAPQDIASSQAACETMQPSSLEPSPKASPADAEHLNPAGAQHFAGTLNSLPQSNSFEIALSHCRSPSHAERSEVALRDVRATSRERAPLQHSVARSPSPPYRSYEHGRSLPTVEVTLPHCKSSPSFLLAQMAIPPTRPTLEAHEVASVADASEQPSLDIQPSKWKSRLQAITELEKRQEAGESLDHVELALLLCKPEFQLEAQLEQNQACATTPMIDASKCAEGGRGCCADQVWREPQVCDSGYLAIPDVNPAGQCRSSYGACATTGYVGSAVGVGQAQGKSRRAKAKASQLAKSGRGCDDYKWLDPRMEMLYQQLNVGGAAQRSALHAIRGKVLHLSTESKESSWVVQRAFDNEVASLSERACFAQELHCSVLKLISCPHGNYIIQHILEVLPTPLIAFVAIEISGRASEVARDRHGCRVLPRLFKHHVKIAPDAHWSLVAVLQEVLIDAVSLLPHAFGHHVVQSIIDHGLPDHRMYVTYNALGCGYVLRRNAEDRSATYVIRAVLEQNGTPHQFHLAQSLLRLGSPFLASLKVSQYGFHVWKALQAFLRQQNTATIASLQLDAATKQEFHLAL